MSASYNDSYWLSQSPVFKNHVQSALVAFCVSVSGATSTGPLGGMPTPTLAARKQMATTILNPAQFNSWLATFLMIVSVDPATINAATNQAVSYTPITQASGTATTGQSGDTATALISDTTLETAITNAFDAIIPGLY